MALHKDINQFVYTTIQEYLDGAKLCIDTLKKDDSKGCYGMAALTLLSSAIDAMGTYFRDPNTATYSLLPDDSKNWKDELGQAKVHYKHIYNEYFSDYFDSETEFTELFYVEYRCHAVHNGMLTEKHHLCKDGGNKQPVVENKGGMSYVYVDSLYYAVREAFGNFQKDHPLPKGNTAIHPNLNSQDSGLTQSNISIQQPLSTKD